MNILKNLIFIITAIFIFSCSNKKEQVHFHEFKEHAWDADETISIPLQIDDTSKTYEINGIIKYNSHFSFSNLSFNISILSPSGSSRFKSLNLNMKEKKDSTAEKNSLEMPFSVYKTIRFNENGTWVLNMTHQMPVDINNGLENLEIRFKSI